MTLKKIDQQEEEEKEKDLNNGIIENTYVY